MQILFASHSYIIQANMQTVKIYTSIRVCGADCSNFVRKDE